MSNNTAKVVIQVTDNGDIKKIEKDASNANKEMGKLVSTAKGMPKAATMAATRARTPEETQYDRARASVGTGAAGRDFANQAQGLSGLVRLYAVYAANIFAVGAAFRALSEAMNTTNMVEGLNQLGAASGISLGNLAKQFTAASGGAISLREAMEATAKATSSGLNSDQFLKLGDVAKKASQALGVNMSDAVSRLTRGITKLEPELLDELGIFTKVGKATEDYAKSVGKAVSALTDFERRQAFANAVLKEGADKFNEINIPTNPYDRLLAGLKDLSQTVLEVVNKALIPLVNILNSSPTALYAVVGALGAMLLKQAIPAIGEYRAGLAATALTAKEFADTRASQAKKALDAVRAASDQEIKIEKEKYAELALLKIDAAETKLRRASKRGLSDGVVQILAKPVQSISDADLAVLDKLGANTTKVAARYRELASTIRESRLAEDSFARTVEALEKRSKQPPPLYSAAGSAQARAESARKSAASTQIISSSGDIAAVLGFSTAIRNSIDSIKTEKLGITRSLFTGIGVAANLAAVGVGRLVVGLSSLLVPITLAVTAYQIMSSFLSKNVEESGKLDSSLKTLQSTTESSANTNKKYGDSISVQSIIAKKNAITEFSTALATSLNDLQSADTKASGFDRFIDGFLTVTGSDLKSKFANNVSSAVTEGIKNVSDPKLKKELEGKIKDLFKVNTISTESLTKAVKELDKTALFSKFKILNEELALVVQKSEELANPLMSMQEGFKELEKDFQSLSNTLINNDPLSKFGSTLVSQSIALSKALKDPITSIAALNSIMRDTSQIKMFPQETQSAILEAGQKIDGINKTLTESQNKLADAQERYNKAIQVLNSTTASAETKKIFVEVKTRAQGEIAQATAAINNANNTLATITGNLTKGFTTSIQKAFSLIEAPLVRAYAQAGINFNKSILDRLPKTAETAKIAGKLEVASIELQKQEIIETRKLIDELELTRLAFERKGLEEEARLPGKSLKQLEQIDESVRNIKERERIIKDPNLYKTGKRGVNLDNMSPEIAKIYQERVGTLTKLAALSGQQQLVIVNAEFSAIENKFSEKSKVLTDSLKNLKEKASEDRESTNYLSKSIEERGKVDLIAKASELALERQISLIDLLKEEEFLRKVIANKSVAANIRKEAETSLKTKTLPQIEAVKARSVESSTAALDKISLETSEKLLKAEEDVRNIVEEQRKVQYSITDTIMERTKTIRTAEVDLEIEAVNLAKTNLEIQNQLGALTEDGYNVKKQELELLANETNYRKELLSIENKKTDAITAASRARDEEFRKTLDPEVFTKFREQIALIDATSESETKLANIRKTASDVQAKSLTLQNEKTKKMEEIFTSAVDNMTDALFEFAMTGKQSFGDMIKNMILDIAKLEFRMSMQNMWKGSGGFSGTNGNGGGLISNVLQWFGGSKAGSNSIGSNIGIGSAMAKGGAWDSGIQKFAKGGSFTNSIVSSPTLFKFAKGTGMMGEAGPEAIMPLKRGKDGSLGVASSAPSTNVVVNNYGKEEAKVTESVDSRGNRRIEVMIGEMVAGEVQRNGSTAQQSIRNTFGRAPVLIRR
jgi:hypothetical protein